MSGSLRFERPPVREVTLALMLQPMPKLQTLDLAPLRVDWRPSYPLLQEVAPLPPWGPADRDAVEFVRSGVSWPMALCTFSTDSGDRNIRFQQDRFLLSWTFGDETQEYPGFGALRSELLEKFSQYSKLTQDASGVAPIVKRADIQYVNHLPGVSAQNAMAGVLNGWTAPASFPFRSPDYCGFRVHYHESELSPQVAVLVGVDSAGEESLEGEIVQSSALSLDAEATVDESANYVEMLELAHNVLTDAFLEVTSNAMREGWGEIS
ncbi:TIGR04255 family protein [Streptomyces sp. t39]|uniref:TIGR04255 family protein n=1 Tax=Streptomyces sp. t39 TaxID=1828156 RepID=UPI0011CE0B4A|nr:TIGR04255 family protein [Streptomyces sp. t39]TXS55764.1 TIGR04255 family protein [Streptomyces sp. t39]